MFILFNIENFLENDKKVKSEFYKIPTNFNYINARDYFKNAPLKNVNKNSIKLKKPKYNKIKEIMVDEYGFKLDKVNKLIKDIKKYFNNSNQEGGILKYMTVKNV